VSRRWAHRGDLYRIATNPCCCGCLIDQVD
jgi:hypothetical protein